MNIGWLDELIDQPWLLEAFAEHARSDADVTLVILADRGADLGRLIALVSSDERLSDDRCEMTVLTTPATTPAAALLADRRELAPDPRSVSGALRLAADARGRPGDRPDARRITRLICPTDQPATGAVSATAPRSAASSLRPGSMSALPARCASRM